MSKSTFSAISISCCLIFLFNACSVNKAKIDNDPKKYFDEKQVEGCFTMLNNSTGEITVYNMAMDTIRSAPGNTFNLFNAMVALETGALTNENMVIKWDSVVSPVKEWNQDANVKTAFQTDNEPFFKEVAKRIGKDRMKQWINQVGYGNKEMGEKQDNFWQNQSLKISSDEQLGLLKRLYFGQLPFRQSVQESVKNMLIKENNTAYTLAYQQGKIKNGSGPEDAWVIGWIEENRHLYFFVTFVKGGKQLTDANKTSLSITRSILSHYGFFKGEK